MSILTPKTETVLESFIFKTKEGLDFHEIIVPGQKEVMECILTRKAPDGSGKKRIHIMAHTRYGKSIGVAAAVAVRASVQKEPWAIVAPTKDQAQIIMDYLIWFSVNDPIISQLLKTDAKVIREERLTQRRSRSHITYLNGGEVRTYHAGETMGLGSPNIVLDESGLISNKEESKIFRMLGDSTDNFIVKIGNPWDSIDKETGQEHHFFIDFHNPDYYQIDIPIERGIKEGRVTDEFHNEVKDKPNYDILYKNIFPDAERADKDGYLPLFTHGLVKTAMIKSGAIISVGDEKLGGDPADGGQNESVIATRSMNLAKIICKRTDLNTLTFADEVAILGKDIDEWYIDKQGVGSGSVRRLEENAKHWRKTTPINAGLPVPETIKENERNQYSNIRAYIFWQFKLWLEQGGKIEEDEELRKQLLAIKYKNDGRGKIKIISKDELRKRGIMDLGRADAISFTFMPKANKKIYTGNNKVKGGAKPYYPKLGL